MEEQVCTGMVYTIRYAVYDAAAQDDALFRKVRSGEEKTSGKKEEFTSGVTVVTRYHKKKHGLKWEKTAGGKLLQKAYPGKGGYAVVTNDLAGNLISKASYGASHEWVQTSYYSGDPAAPAAVVRPDGGNLLLLSRDAESGKYRKTVLVPRNPLNTPQQSLLDERIGPPVISAWAEQGQFYYYPEETVKAQDALQEEGNPEPASWTSQGSSGAGISFQYVGNDGSTPEEPENQIVQEVLADAEPPLPEIEEKELEDRAKPVEDHASYSIDRGEFSSEEQDAAEFAEAVLHPEDITVKTIPAEAVHMAEKEEEKTASEQIRTIPKRYGVASKDRKGVIRHTAALADGLRPVKQIVVSEKETYAYFGDLLDGLRHGQGRTQMSNGHTAYEGDYCRDKRNGFGTYYYKSGKLCYAGNWEMNRRQGMGVSFSSTDGSVYIGQWRDNMPSGNGSLFDEEGSLLYTGNWEQGIRCGQGTEYVDGTIRYQGSWKDDCYEGFGKLYLGNGNVVWGEFQNGKVHGIAEERTIGGEPVFSGLWRGGSYSAGILYVNGRPTQYKE